MKVAELREKLSKLKKEELIKIAVEFYKLVPKAKKEDYALDNFINSPTEKKTQTADKEQLNLVTIEKEVKKFIEHAKAQYYLAPNRIVPKKERSTWRFKVKKWYKELTNTKRSDVNLEIQAKLLSDLYELLCEACGYQYFTSDDPFESIGVEQDVFFASVIAMIQEVEGKGDSIEKGIKLIVDNFTSRNMLPSYLMTTLIETLNIAILKEKGIEVVKKLIIKNNFQPKLKEQKKVFSFSQGEYKQQDKHNNLVELGFRLYGGLYEIEEGINFYQAHYYYFSDEIKLYILIRLLFEDRQKDKIKDELEKAITKGIEPRENLLNLLKEIKETDQLPKYMR